MTRFSPARYNLEPCCAAKHAPISHHCISQPYQMFGRVLYCIWLIGLAAIPAAAQELHATTVHTAHYDAYLEMDDSQDISRLLEQMYFTLSLEFGARPTERLRIKVFSTEVGYQYALTKDGVSTPFLAKAGGAYVPKNKTVYLWTKFYPYSTRQMLIHECVHQFHFLATTHNRLPYCRLYYEGRAEDLALHQWDGVRLRIADPPELTPWDIPNDAMQHLRNRQKPISLKEIACEESEFDYAEACAITQYLRTKYPSYYAMWATLSGKLVPPAEAWDRAFGTIVRTSDYMSWLAKHQNPWEAVFWSWDQAYDTIDGKAPLERAEGPLGAYDQYALALLREPVSSFSCNVLQRDCLSAGIVVGFVSKLTFTRVELSRDVHVVISSVEDGKWSQTYLDRFTAKLADQTSVCLSAESRDGVRRVLINGLVVVEFPAREKSRTGLVVTKGQARFTNLHHDRQN